MGGADVLAIQVKEYKLLQRERALRTASVTFGLVACSTPERQDASKRDAARMRRERPKNRRKGASSRSSTNSASQAHRSLHSRKKKDSTCFANMPYVTSEFGPSEEGVGRVDYVVSLGMGPEDDFLA